MSFSSEVKKALCHLPVNDQGEGRAELSGLLMSATIDDAGIVFDTENPTVAGRLRLLSTKLYQEGLNIQTTQEKQFGSRRIYRVYSDDKAFCERVVRDVRLGKRSKIPPYFLSKQRYVKGYLRGVFLGCGSMTTPQKSYRLELVSNNAAWLTDLGQTLGNYDIQTKLHIGEKQSVLRIRDGKSLSAFLGLIGANAAVLEIENVKILRGMRGNANRQVNCDVANVQKVTKASQSQMAAIRILDEAIGIENLPPELSKVAIVRRNNPDYSLAEIGKAVDPPMSKTAVNYRMNKLKKMAQSYKRK